MNTGRYFPTPSLVVVAASKDDSRTSIPTHSKDEYYSVARDLANRCFLHYEPEDAPTQQSHYGSLYSGGLGPCTYLRLRLALHHQSLNTDRGREEAISLLRDGIQATEATLRGESSSGGGTKRPRRERCTLLEGRSIGALAMHCALLHAMGRDDEAQISADHLLAMAKNDGDDSGMSPLQALQDGECEVLYGRAGYLQAILFIRSYLSNPTYGQEIVPDILQTIVSAGLVTAREGSTGLPLVWEWHGKKYLGSAHGVSGILFTLLHFLPELRAMGEEMDRDIVALVRETVDGLDGMCFSSGNLPSSVGKIEKDDKLVQWCHGTPGYILLLTKAAGAFGEIRYLERAEEVARDVVFRRGLLRKGVGLCHGIAGNAYAFLSIHRTINTTAARAGEGTGGVVSNDEFLLMAQHFANFAIHRLADLAHVPDRPYSLYEGLAGLAALLLDLYNPDKSRFPCFEF